MKQLWRTVKNRDYKVSYLDFSRNEIKSEMVRATSLDDAYSKADPETIKLSNCCFITAEEK